MKREGQIKVHSENMFPIIKKWLYSDKDIFLRELVSNACDAIRKLENLKNIGESTPEDFKPRIDVYIDKENSIIKITDNGIGMTEDEVIKYITQIAFSGAEDFIEQYKDKTDAACGIIGHFGLGFYSAFMVSDTVEIDTLSYKDNARAVHWKSDGTEIYEIEDGSKKTRGTTITLHISKDETEFLQKAKISEMLRKYCKFMPYEIYFEVSDDEKNPEMAEAPVNNTTPLWLKAPKDCTKEEYEKFYSEIFLDFNPPLFWIHLNIDYPFNLKGILYFPKQTNKLEVIPGEIKLFNNQVYIADNIKEVVPEFLMLLKGVIDCPDLPLNVSRSFLQNDSDVLKISRHITKKVADKLNSIFVDDRKKFETYWEDISPFIKFGCIKDEKFYDKVKDIILFKTINSEYMTIKEFPKQDNLKIFYVSDEDVQAQYIKMFKENGLNAAVLNHMIDNHFVSFLEHIDQSIKFARIDSDITSSMKVAEVDVNLSECIIKKFKDSLQREDVIIKAEHLNPASTPAIILLSEEERRMQDMSAMYGNMFGNIPKTNTTIILNLENDVVKNIEKFDGEKLNLICKNIFDLAMISHKHLSADEISSFVDRSMQILSEFIPK